MKQTGFPPVADKKVVVLVLGSMPGAESLKQQQYYAYLHNAFWPIMGELFGFDPALPYSDRLTALMQNHVALWDVAHQCVRPGSLDSNIRDAEANDFSSFFKAHAKIESVFFNGTTAEQLYRKLVFPKLPATLRQLPKLRLPSTSPAHAGMTVAQKLELWREVRRKRDQALSNNR